MRIIFLLLAVVIFSCNQNKPVKQAYQWPGATPPVAEKKDHETGMPGDHRNDEYYWMGDFVRVTGSLRASNLRSAAGGVKRQYARFEVYTRPETIVRSRPSAA